VGVTEWLTCLWRMNAKTRFTFPVPMETAVWAMADSVRSKSTGPSRLPASKDATEIDLPCSKGLKYIDFWRKTRKLPQQANQAM
jgi:hypothetical protein